VSQTHFPRKIVQSAAFGPNFNANRKGGIGVFIPKQDKKPRQNDGYKKNTKLKLRSRAIA
jgi:hypothetical protein